MLNRYAGDPRITAVSDGYDFADPERARGTWRVRPERGGWSAALYDDQTDRILDGYFDDRSRLLAFPTADAAIDHVFAWARQVAGRQQEDVNGQ